MKFALALFAAGLVAAQDFSGIPQCAISCLQEAIPKVGCALTDTACQCAADKQEALVPVVAPCLLSACSSGDVGKAQAAAADACKQFLATASPGSPRPSATGPVAATVSAAAPVTASGSHAASATSSTASVVASVSTPSNATGAPTTPPGSRTPPATGTPTGPRASASAPATGAASQGHAAVGGVAVAALFGIVAAL